MNPVERIRDFFGIRDGVTSPWTVKVLGDHSAEIWFGKDEFIGTLYHSPTTDGWVCCNLYQPQSGGEATTLLSVMGIHVGGGLQNFLSAKAKIALRASIAEYVTKQVLEKAKNLK